VRGQRLARKDGGENGVRSFGTIAEAPADVEFEADRGGDENRRSAVLRLGRKKYRPTEEIDGQIRAAYDAFVYGNDRRAIRAAGKAIGWPPHQVHGRAVELGLARVKEKNWSLEEVAILEANCQYGFSEIQKRLAAAGFARSQYAILLKRKRLDLVRAYEGYSANQLGTLMGIDSKGVGHYIEEGWLKAEKRGTWRTERQGGDTWYIAHEDVRAFLFARPEEWDLRKVEKWWFLDLITDGRICR
jgi:hypothetical protein